MPKRKLTDSFMVTDKPLNKKIKAAVKKANSKPALTPKFKMTRMTLAPFAAKKRTTLIYCDVRLVTPAVTSPSTTTWNFILNGLFDPQVAIGGHQPYGFDQWMAIYKRFTVVSATARLTCNCTEGTYYSGNFGMNIAPSDATPVTDEQTSIESQYSVWKPYSQNSAINTCVIKLDVAKYFGVHDVMDDDTLSGTNLSDPVKQAYLNCWTSGNLATTPQSSFTLVITYDAIFHEPREVGAS